ncbi:hypothetical protein IWW36_002740 [Coemansia brasiliensis]|uniref:acylaminoacyl-peptidase n=1 Tax=Coemansia brasiliensis TaxID=2650707 RepID=A0A9W8ICX4_9FUNG|nr:hypothetical protein IWW36_002740 [Coemansia brasiliensis]
MAAAKSAIYHSSAQSASQSINVNRDNSRASVAFARTARKVFESTYGTPTFTTATALRSATQPSVVSIDYLSSQRDFTRDCKRQITGHITLALCDSKAVVLARSTPADVSNVSGSQPCPVDPSIVAVLRTASESERFVEIWRDGVLEKSVDVSNVHGQFYADSTFGRLAWSHSGTYVVYAAEKPQYEKAQPDKAGNEAEYDEGEVTDEITGSVAGIADPRRYRFDSDWGETFSGKRPPVLIVFEVDSGRVRVLPSPEGISPGQAQCLDDRIVFTGYQHAVRKHGIVYCQNRPSGIYTCDFGGKDVRCLFSGSVRSPRITPSRKGLVFLSTATGGPHASTSELLHYDLATDSVSTLVPIIDEPLEVQQRIGGTLLPQGFVGIYTDQLPSEPWISTTEAPDCEVMVFSSTWRSTTAVLALDLYHRALSLHSPIDGSCDCEVLGANGDIVIAKHSTPAQSESLMIGETKHLTQELSICWHKPDQPTASNTEWEVVRGSQGGESRLESIFIYPPKPDHDTHYFWADGNPASRPLAVVPHGGPHSTYTVAYNPLVAGLVRLGFGVLLVNFTGSLGFGQNAVLAQIGKMDTLSIDEIQEAASNIHSHKAGDIQRTVYVGGSYSGYAGALLAGTVPGFYRGIVLRNPVISIGENAAMSDIPDWAYAELGLDYSFEAPPELTPAEFTAMWRASPSRLVDKVKDPLLLLLGAGDRRVPPAQSYSYFARLKAAGAPVQCKVYPDVGHPLNTVEAERDSFVSIARFFASALKK